MCPTAAAKRLKCARSLLLPPHHRCFEERENELVACADDCRLRWLPTRILRDCRFAPTAELDLHLYAIGCDIVIARQILRACVYPCNALHMSPTPPSCNCGTLRPGSLQVMPLQPMITSCSVTRRVSGSSLSLAKYRLPTPNNQIEFQYQKSRCTGTSGPSACPLYFAVSIGEGVLGALRLPMLLCALEAV